MNSPRLVSGALTLTAAALVGLALHEGYIERARPPVPGDVPTKGFGTTRNADGSPVKLADATTPPRALVDLLRDATASEKAIKRCAPVPMYPHEFSAFVSLAYNVGAGAVCASSIPDKLAAGRYDAACRTILDFDKFRDCTKPKIRNARTGKLECPLIPLRGLTVRRQAEYKMCMGED
ncbi:Phage-related lysozyme [Aromatoleum aromaticum EbN1]|uniref:Lysozyme n=1 Tax=Aromatoleum aromaticum (strain DSM 19018 / LMG 30748 / EbN1) TaxID=76114 RepID=Q5NXI8_AROAE|nr:glycoside hydrolase family protein [Aromatoleum aromaticum]CAI10226.1 Phage-related lysozyme [Aromatoleum aromaticum EbN1]